MEPSTDAAELAASLQTKIGDCALYEGGRRRPGQVPLELAGQVARETDGFVWIGLQEATHAEIALVAEAFDLPALAVEDAVKAHQRPKLEVYDDVVFVVLKPVRYVDHHEIVEVSEIALFVGPNFVVTVRHGHSDVLGQVRAELEHEAAVLVHGPTGVLYRAADLVVDGYEETIDLINDDVDEIEQQVFGADEVGHAERIYKLKREIAGFRRAVVPLAAPVEHLAQNRVPGIDPTASAYFRDVHDHLLRSIDAIEGHDRLLSDVLQADLARLGVRQSEIAVRQNEDMRKISAWAAIALLPTAIAGIYGMNFENMPELDWEYGYFVVVGSIVAACLALHRMFRRKGWL
jgi:magnesium transporter